jgi:hypothetical protein
MIVIGHSTLRSLATLASIANALTIPAVCTDGDHPVRAVTARLGSRRASLKARRVEVAGVASQKRLGPEIRVAPRKLCEVFRRTHFKIYFL